MLVSYNEYERVRKDIEWGCWLSSSGVEEKEDNSSGLYSPQVYGNNPSLKTSSYDERQNIYLP